MFHVIEDDVAVADALVLMLRAFNHEVRAYPDAETFLRDAVPGTGDTVIVDLALPGMSGGDLLRRMPGAESGGPRIVVISGEPQSRLERHLAGLSAPYVIRKPVEVEDIRRLV